MALVELYTSQGCSSCPPADRWLSKAWPTPRFDQAVPLALHVNYWDYIGWKDPYADARFTDRQRAYAASTNSNTIYTPQILVNGLDERKDRVPALKRIAAINQQAAAFKLSLSARMNESMLQVYLQTDALDDSMAPPKAFIALTQSGLASRVTRGENAGEWLRNDHVVRRFSGALEPARNGRLIHQMAQDDASSGGSLHVVAWVESTPGRVEQVTGCRLTPASSR